MKVSLLLDKIGICASAVCLIHCLAIPILLILGLDTMRSLIDQEWIEMAIIVSSFFIGLLAFVSGYLQHRQHFVPVLFVSGFLLLINGEAINGEFQALMLSIVGAGLLIYSHLQNLSLKRKANVG